MFQRLILPLAFRSFLVSVVIAAVVCVFIAPVRLLRGDQAMAATLKDVSAGVSWTGTAVASSAGFDPATCAKEQTCDEFTLKVELTETYRTLYPNFALTVEVGWEDPQQDFDLYLNKDGKRIEDSAQGQTDSEELRIDRPENGIYQIFIHSALVAAATSYNGHARIVESPLSPAFRTARYQKDPDGKYGPEMFQFAPETVLDKNDDALNARTAIAIDPFGNTYVASDGSSLAIGDPNGALGKLYAQEHPQWAAALGTRLYVASSENLRLLLRRSDDGGRMYKAMSVITQLSDPAAVAGQGNLITNGRGILYNVFTGGFRNEIYLAKCVEPCERFATRRIFTGGSGLTVDHPYPVVALDRAGGLHVVFGDGGRILIVSSKDGGATWKDPAVVNNPDDSETKAATSPWVLAGDPGRVGIVWLASTGQVFYAFTSDAFAVEPSFNYVAVSNTQANPNRPSAAADPFGNTNIVYGQTRLLRQIGGDRLILDAFMTAAGFVKTETGRKRVSFNVRQDFSGNLVYLDEERKISLRSTHFLSSERPDQKLALSGRGRLQDGSEVTFSVIAAEPTSKEKDFSISMSNGYFAAGLLEETVGSRTVSGRVTSYLAGN